MKKRKICIITGSRAEWGLFYPLLCEIRKNKSVFTFQVIATGAHLSGEYGLTYKEIEKDGFVVDMKVEVPFQEDTEEATVRSVGLGMIGFVEALRSLKPDLVFLLGDRFETFSAATASFFLKIPIAHIHGGELTEGSLDNTLRHAITKMAHLHFVTTEDSRKRVIQMGEEPSRVFNVGAPGLDNIRNTKLLSKQAFEKETGFKLGGKNALVTFNPPTAESRSSSKKQLKDLLKILDKFKDIKIIFTKPNPDMYSRTISSLIDDYVSKNPERCISFASMGRILYLSAFQFVDFVAGNSSSGIIEAPSFGIPTINIGNRQKGRVRAGSVIDIEEGNAESISKAIEKAFSEDFKRTCKRVKNPYGEGEASGKIVRIIKKIRSVKPQKRFFNVNFKI